MLDWVVITYRFNLSKLGYQIGYRIGYQIGKREFCELWDAVRF